MLCSPFEYRGYNPAAHAIRDTKLGDTDQGGLDGGGDCGRRVSFLEPLE
jgi:hypothetical protein